MDAGPERPHLGAIFLAPSARSASRPGELISEGGRWREAWARVASDHRRSWPCGGHRGGGAGARPWARAGHWRVAWARVRRGGRGDLARNAFGFLFRRLFRRIPSVTGQRVGPPLFSLSL